MFLLGIGKDCVPLGMTVTSSSTMTQRHSPLLPPPLELSPLSTIFCLPTMEEAMYFTPEENIPMSSRSWIWKKRRNAVFPTTETQSKTEAWVQTVIPSHSQVIEDSLRSNAEPRSQEMIISSVPLPGSVTDYLDEIQVHHSHAVKSIAVDEETRHGEIKQGQSWLNKLGFNKNKVSFLKCFNEWKGNKTLVPKGNPNSPRIMSHDKQLGGCLSKEEQTYIPYRLAKLYITKIIKDMHQMKIGYMKVIKELECAGKENQEQGIMALKNQYSNKMKILRVHLEAYQKLIDQKNQDWQITVKRLEEENNKLRQENEVLVKQIRMQKEEWDNEKACLLKSTTEKLDCIYTQHTLTIEELQKTRLHLKKVQKIVNFQMDLPCDQQKAVILSDEVTQNRATSVDTGNMKSDLTAQKSETTESDQSAKSFVVEIGGGNDCSPQKKLLLEVRTTLEMVEESLQKQYKDISELLQSEYWSASQITNAALLTRSVDTANF
ncbi:uncharacterized protein LOC132570607 isoform X2 [Heteronotia binoei]|uniref:uncharacterized protein LOC132570607 isoform X2 n=1 Tax=Heteronotia binoei TaxID=13085 RepID=UPI00292E267F|nr:uncharacterized protein LOC132570607 isoform X2 [Heteronotia binoei]